MNAVHWGATVARGSTAGIAAARVQLVAQMEQLAQAPDEVFATEYEALLSSLERQLRAEERALEAVNSRALHSHREHHAHALAALDQVEAGDVATGRAALALLGQWLVLHQAALDLAHLTGLASAARRTSRREPFPRPRPAAAFGQLRRHDLG